MTFLAAAIAVLIGSLPSTDWLGRAARVDVRAQGTRNPGTRNAWTLGGPGLGMAVLAAELIKGAGAIALGRLLADDAGGAVAAVGAVAGNVYNPWFRFRGGKGLAITGGTLLGVWPIMVPILGVVIGSLMVVFRRSGPAALITFALYIVAALFGLSGGLPAAWGLADPGWLVVAAVGSCMVMVPKHLADTFTPARPPPSPA